MSEKGVVVLFAASWCERSRELTKFLELLDVSFVLADPDSSREACDELIRLTGGNPTVPALLTASGVLLREPSDREVAAALGLTVPADREVCDLAIVGAGPAGLTAAIYAAREGLKTLVFERGAPGGQAAMTDAIENYPGFPEPVNGFDLTNRMYEQAARFGAEFRTGEEIASLSRVDGHFLVATPSGSQRARSVLVATGAGYRRMGVPGEERLLGHGVSFCATCDAPFYRGREVVVTGGGNSALQETLHLARFASRITLIVRGEKFSATPVLSARVTAMEAVRPLFSHRIEEVLGDGGVTGVRVADAKTGETRIIPCDGLFVFIGQTPNSDFLKGALNLDTEGFVVTDPSTLETSLPGVFAAGDVRSGSKRQISAAVGEATTASFMVRKYLENLHRGCELK